MSWPGIEPGPSRWEASTLEKNHLNSLLIAVWNLYRAAAVHVAIKHGLIPGKQA
jgi:hypothetical protein